MLRVITLKSNIFNTVLCLFKFKISVGNKNFLYVFWEYVQGKKFKLKNGITRSENLYVQITV